MDQSLDKKLTNAEQLMKVVDILDKLKKQITQLQVDVSYIKQYVVDEKAITTEPIKYGWFY